MFRLIKQMFVSVTMSNSLPSINSLECTSINNQECKVRPEIVNINVKSLYFILLV